MLDSFDPQKRSEALRLLSEKIKSGQISLPEPTSDVNLHCHTFFSYNAYGYSPTHFAWLARKNSLAVAGIVDFDVLDGMDEFLDAGRVLNLKTCVGMETRVFIPEFADMEINSPGEPGISYHMGIGFPQAILQGENRDFLLRLKQTAQKRNRELMARVNRYLSPVELDYDRDILPLTPAGNATERHMCLSYALKAANLFPDKQKLADFWADRLDVPLDSVVPYLPDGIEILNRIRAKTMKRGGVGYITPDTGSFPRMDQTNKFILAAGAIPAHTWLDGTSQGEQHIEELLEVAISTGAAAINIIPDRNYTPHNPDRKLANLYNVVDVAKKMNLPIIVGTEMNSSGQKFVDNFKSPELAPLLPEFLKSAYIFYAHSVLQQKCSKGYTSEWAKEYFPERAERNEFFTELGRLITPQREDELAQFQNDVNSKTILKSLTK